MSLANILPQLGLQLGWLPMFLGFATAILAYEIIIVPLSRIPSVSTFSSTLCPVPRFIRNAEFALGANKILAQGYQQFYGKAFQIVRGDGNVVVLPQDLVEELAALPPNVATPNGALEHDLLGHYTGLNLILESRLHVAIVQRKLTPRLRLISKGLEEELNSAVSEELKSVSRTRWEEIQPYHVLAKVSARLSARALVGPELCRDPIWLGISRNFPEDLFRTVVILRLFPTWMHPLLSKLLPSYWRGRSYVQLGKKLLSQPIARLLEKSDLDCLQTGAEAQNVMTWLADAAKGSDRNTDVLAHLQVLLALASVHTILLRLVNVLYDLIAHRQYLPELLDEIQLGNQGGQWDFDSYQRLDKLDSVMRESQRLSPPTTLGMKRIFKAPYTFEANGLHIPRDTYVCMPVLEIENDSIKSADPRVFDGYRSLKLRQDSNETDAHRFSTTSSTALNFGYGKSACPGRYFASLVIKMVFVKLLTTFEFKFKPGQGRPANVTLHEFLFPWPEDKILIRRQEQVMCPF